VSKNDTFIAKYCQSSRFMGIDGFAKLLKSKIYQNFLIKFNILHAFCTILMSNKKVSRVYVHLFSGHLQNKKKW